MIALIRLHSHFDHWCKCVTICKTSVGWSHQSVLSIFAVQIFHQLKVYNLTASLIKQGKSIVCSIIHSNQKKSNKSVNEKKKCLIERKKTKDSRSEIVN